MQNFVSTKINLPQNIKIKQNSKGLTISGPLGSNTLPLRHLDNKGYCNFRINTQENYIEIGLLNDKKSTRSFLFTLGKLIKKQILGVTQGFSIGLELVGVGYRFRYDKVSHYLYMKVGYSDECVYELPESIVVFQKNQTQIKLYGIDNEKVTQTASTVKRFFPPDPYKGKGIRYENEILRLKPGKKK